MNKKIDITITYEDGVVPDKAIEQNGLNSVNSWLEPLVDELLANDVTAELYIDRLNIQHLIMSNNISNELKDKVQLELEKYQFRLDSFRPNSQ